jgi:hypothetical protein
MPDAARHVRDKRRLAALGTTPHRLRVERTQGRIERATGQRISRRHAAGHVPSGAKSVGRLLAERLYLASWLTVGPPEPGRLVTLEVSYSEARRAGRYWDLVRQLREGRISPVAFRRRVVRWLPIAGSRLLADPRGVLALLVMGAGDDVAFYGTRGSRRRAA